MPKTAKLTTMKPKKFIAHCELLALLRSNECETMPEAPQRLAAAFDRFADRLTRAAGKTESPHEMLRLYAYLRLVFRELKTGKKQPGKGRFYIEAALSYLEAERHLLLLQIRFPALMPSADPARGNITWSSAYTHTDLMELISALHAAGAICKADGRPVELKSLIRAFERFLNVTIRNPERCRYATLNRCLHLTKFLDRLREALIERSQR